MYYGVKSPHGGDIYESDIRLDFSANVNPFGAPKEVIAAAKDAMEEAGKYPDPYCRELVFEIAKKEEIPADDVLIGCGASELIYSYCLAARFKKAVLAAPSFAEYASALLRAGSDLCYYMLKKENGFVPDKGIVDFILREKPDAVFLCNPNNPTGRAIAPDLLKEILKITAENRIRLFLDECFYELSDEPFTLKDELETHPNLFILRAFTKCFALAGLRLGYCLCADHELFEEMSTYMPPWSVSHPAQKAGVAALKEEGYLKETKEKILAEREWLREKLCEIGIIPYPSDVNYLFFESEKDLAERLKEEGILIRKCNNYVGLSDGYYRIAVRTHEENEALIQAMKKVKH